MTLLSQFASLVNISYIYFYANKRITFHDMKKTDWKLTSYFAMFCNCAWQNTLHEVNS